ncbi:MAG: hypothetical protein IJT84_03830 [Clostridia bacterium]|nr:hypothetical protein [Clostridia bacterium]
MKKLLATAVLLLVLISVGCSEIKISKSGNSDLEHVSSMYMEARCKDDYNKYIDLIPEFCKRNIIKSLGLSENATDDQIIKELERYKDDDAENKLFKVLSVSVLSREKVNDFSKFKEFNKVFNGTVTADDYETIKEIAKVRVDYKEERSGEEFVEATILTCVMIDNHWLVAFNEQAE